MSTEVILTGTGIPNPHPDRAGSGTLVRHGDAALQFDAGRATTMRLAQAGLLATQISALFLTHHHFDHMLGVADLAFCRWLSQSDDVDDPLTAVAPAGPLTRFLARALDAWDEEIAVRLQHTGRQNGPRLDIVPFDAGDVPKEVWRLGDVTVSSVAVEHPPVQPSVAYRVDTPDGSAVISGDTRVCRAIEKLSANVDVLVHEVMLGAPPTGSQYAPMANYHSDPAALGAMAERAGVRTLMLTHLAPPFPKPADVIYEQRVRAGGYSGNVVVGWDLDRHQIGAADSAPPEGRRVLT